ncbi:hypothetical protein PORY_001864 [Pneumocystis oryctolagi]|uniref:Uncharacterized protein n=1 Tax=Pneumocystis oryctolagi TaxID=42067 RepID=A0ACB7CB85_9ASCO|nr:hypothetical protein PORY_001864 [Pneumocystis oryctolagi]
MTDNEESINKNEDLEGHFQNLESNDNFIENSILKNPEELSNLSNFEDVVEEKIQEEEEINVENKESIFNIETYQETKDPLENLSNASSTSVRDNIDKGFNTDSHIKKEESKLLPYIYDSSMEITERSSFGYIVFVIQALETILLTKEAKKNAQLKDSVFKALDTIKTDASPSPYVILKPLKYACETLSSQCTIPALDCLSKLVSYSFFVDPLPSIQQPYNDTKPAQETTTSTVPIMEQVIDTICNCFQGDITDSRVQLQTVKALLAAVLNENPKTIIHQNTLLKAVRQTYNIFLLSKNTSNQIIIQGILTQMVHTIFGRIKTKFMEDSTNKNTNPSNTMSLPLPFSEEKDESSQLNFNIDSETYYSTIEEFNINTIQEKLTNLEVTCALKKNILDSFEDSKSSQNSDDLNVKESQKIDESQLFIRDAFILFRILCKLSIKLSPYENVTDLKSHSMKSKLLSLHLIYSILNNYMEIFTSKNIKICLFSSSITFMDAIKEHLCLTLTRNFISPVQQVFNISCEIFWKMIGSMRMLLKVEIAVFLKEIFLPILEMRNSTYQQKQILLEILQRISNDPKVLVEVYLNYDCDRSAIINILSKVATSSLQTNQYQQHTMKVSNKSSITSPSLPLSPSLSILVHPSNSENNLITMEYNLKLNSLKCIVSILQSFVSWSQEGVKTATTEFKELPQNENDNNLNERVNDSKRLFTSGSSSLDSTDQSNKLKNNVLDDPEIFEALKHRKNILSECIKKFNSKPQKGIEALYNHKFIKSLSPGDIAAFLYETENLNKTMLGEYLGEGNIENISIMHSFVDLMDFSRMSFVDALRKFLQSFRLPGEAQKIDRYMLKFAERYVNCNPGAFTNADTAYILAYSVIILNTDLHNPHIKKRMSLNDFIKNTGKINDGESLPEKYLTEIYEEISNNEIVLKDEQDAALMSGLAHSSHGLAPNLSNILGIIGRNIQRETYMTASEEMANKTETLFKNILKAQKKGLLKPASIYYSASHFEHVGPMFEIAWIPILASISDLLQSQDDSTIVSLCLEAFKLSIQISCLFDLKFAKNAFISTLTKFTNLGNLNEMKIKNVNGIKALLEIALSEGNSLNESWKDVLTCVSQLERFQLINSGVDELFIPDVGNAKIKMQNSINGSQKNQTFQLGRSSLRLKLNSQITYNKAVAEEAGSREVTHLVDKIFTQSAHLSGDAIIDFVRALSEVSWEEIQSSGSSENPRMFSLQKLVEISYYNMARIRMEWSNLWIILGKHFNKVGCLHNIVVVFFALDSLRQLAMRFFDTKELSYFKFQKDFLKPFQHILTHNPTEKVKEMVLICLQQMIQARANDIRSGWRTMFSVFQFAAREEYENIVNFSFVIVKQLSKENLDIIVSQNSFADLIICLTEFSKNDKYQAISLESMKLLKSIIDKVLEYQELPLTDKSQEKNIDDDSMIKYWFPVLFGFYDILMTGEDLETRSRALNYLFNILILYGINYTPSFWDTVCRQLLFPIFTILKSQSETFKNNAQEHLSSWISNIMVQTLLNVVELLDKYFDIFEKMLDGFFEFFVTCVCQENDVLAKTSINCFQQLILQKVDVLKNDHWYQIVNVFETLFETTTPHQLLECISVNNEPENIDNSEINSNKTETSTETQKFSNISLNNLFSLTRQSYISEAFNEDHISESYQPSISLKKRSKNLILKCVIQLFLIDSLGEILKNDNIFSRIPLKELLRIIDILENSWNFARQFNSDKQLRINLWKNGFMKNLPNLLRQETNSVSICFTNLFKMYFNSFNESVDKDIIRERLIMIFKKVLAVYCSLDTESQLRNIQAWRPIIIENLNAFIKFENADFVKYIGDFYQFGLDILGKDDIDCNIRISLKELFEKIRDVLITNR